MDKKEIAEKKRKTVTLQRRLCKLGPMMRGSVALIGTRNKQFYFSLNKAGRTKLIYFGRKRVDRAKEYSENYKKLLEIVEEMTILNMELLKEDTFS